MLTDSEVPGRLLMGVTVSVVVVVLGALRRAKEAGSEAPSLQPRTSRLPVTSFAVAEVCALPELSVVEEADPRATEDPSRL